MLQSEVLEEAIRKVSAILELMKRTFNEKQNSEKKKLLCFTCGRDLEDGRRIKSNVVYTDPITDKKTSIMTCSEPCYYASMQKLERDRRVGLAHKDAMERE